MNTGLWLVVALLALWVVAKRVKVHYRVQTSLRMAAPEAQVLAAITDFEQWPHWSPWLMHEPDCILRFQNPTEVGGHYDWDGQRIGAGRITHLSRPDAHTIPTELQFLRPFKAKALATLTVRALNADECDVQWTMDGALPVFMAPMRRLMSEMLTKDFELGLAHLAGYLNPQAEHPVITFESTMERPSFHAVTQRESTTLSQLPEVFNRLLADLATRAGDAVCDAPMGVYHRINPKSGAVDMEVALPVAEFTPGATLVRGGHYARTTLRGNYRFIQLAWHAAYGQARMNKHKWDAQSPALERYVVGPDQTPDSNAWVTELYLPVKEK